MNIKNIMKDLSVRLSKVSSSPELDSEILMMKGLSVSRTYLHTHNEKIVPDSKIQTLEELVTRRMNKEPIAYILGKKEFWSRGFYINQHTLIPRPESEMLVELIIQTNSRKKISRILELGTGCGCISVSIAKELSHSQIVSTDICAKALEVANKNAQHYGVNNISFIKSDWFNGLENQKFDCIVSNPPYIRKDDPYLSELTFEPSKALVSGDDGLEAIEIIVSDAAEYLSPEGKIFIEHGKDQEKEIQKIFELNNWKDIICHRDLGGLPRITAAKISV
jgi:release factor glutamine methyltransferase